MYLFGPLSKTATKLLQQKRRYKDRDHSIATITIVINVVTFKITFLQHWDYEIPIVESKH